MGTQKGFLGKSLLAFVILICLVRRWRPSVFIHECTRLFRWTVLGDRDLLPGYTIHTVLIDPTEYGFPVRRGRSYSAIVRNDWMLGSGLSNLFRLHVTSACDAGHFFSATQAEARGGYVGRNFSNWIHNLISCYLIVNVNGEVESPDPG